MSPLSDGSDRSLAPASFCLGGGTWDPISSDAAFDLSPPRHKCAFFVPSARAIYALPRRCERWGVQRESRTVHNVTRHSSKHICPVVYGRSSRVHHLSAPRVSRSPSLPFSPLHLRQHHARNANATSVYSRTGSTPTTPISARQALPSFSTES